jgi:hypothetical protein
MLRAHAVAQWRCSRLRGAVCVFAVLFPRPFAGWKQSTEFALRVRR